MSFFQNSFFFFYISGVDEILKKGTGTFGDSPHQSSEAATFVLYVAQTLPVKSKSSHLTTFFVETTFFLMYSGRN